MPDYSDLIPEVMQLWSSGLCSQRGIARQLGIPRTTIAKIILGKYRVAAREKRLVNSADPPFDLTQPPQRCPRCGGLVYMPCRLCYIRQLKRPDRLGSSIKNPARRAA